MQKIQTNQVKQFPNPHCGWWAVVGLTTGLSMALLFAYATEQFSSDTIDTKEKLVEEEPKPSKNYYIFTTIEGKTVKLPEFEVLDIIQMNENGVLLNEIADKYNMSPVNIIRIINQISSIIINK